MATTELEEVMALFERVRPDPAGFAQRLLLQVMNQWGALAGLDPASFPDAATNGALSGKADQTPSVGVSHDGQADIDTNALLAGALGACKCWGMQADCETCGGKGTTGWTKPDQQLFETIVEPAIVKLYARANGRRRTSTPKRTSKNEGADS